MADRQERVLPNPETDFERQDWNIKAVAILAIIIFAFLVLIPLILRGAFPQAVTDASRKQAVVPPAPLLQTDPSVDLKDFRAEEEARLNSYGWIDRDKGIVHMPLDEAMKQILEKGVPDFPKAP
jgi:hypothetical protein